MRVFISILDYASGERDVEVLDAEPTADFHDSITEAEFYNPGGDPDGRIVRAEIREGNVNGGDSVTVWTWEPTYLDVDVIAAQYAGTVAQAREAGISREVWVEGCLDDIADTYPGVHAATLAAIAAKLTRG